MRRLSLTRLLPLLVSFCAACTDPFASEAPRLATSSGWVSVPTLQPSEWTCLPVEATQAGCRTEMIRCSLSRPGSILHLIAKDYRVPDSAVLSAQVLATQVYARQYSRIYTDIRVGSSAPVRWAGAHAWDTSFAATHKVHGTLSKVERVAVVGSHVLVLSAEGLSGDAVAHQDTIVTWFERARFSNL